MAELARIESKDDKKPTTLRLKRRIEQDLGIVQQKISDAKTTLRDLV